MTAGVGAGVTSGERFRSWADIQANAPRARGRSSRRWASCEDDSVALMLRNDFATFEVNMAAGQLGAYAVPINWHFTAEEAGYILGDCARQGAGGRTPTCWRRSPPGIPAGVKVLAVPTPDRDRRRLQRAAREAPAAGRHRDLGRLRGAQRAQHRAAQGVARQHDLHIGHDRPAQGRAPPTLVARACRPPRRRKSARYWGLSADPSIVVLMNGPMYHSAPNAYGGMSVRAGGEVILEPRFDPEELLPLIERHCVTHLHMVPTMFVRLLKLPDAVRGSTICRRSKFVVHAAAPCPPDIERGMIEWWGPVINEILRRDQDGRGGVLHRGGMARASGHRGPRATGREARGARRRRQ